MAETYVIDRQGLRILLVDDNPASRERTVALLRELGHQPDAAGTIRAGLESFSRGYYDMVMACHESARDGVWELAAAIKRAAPATPVVVVSAEPLAAMPADVDQLVAEPLTLVKLWTVIDRASTAPVATLV